MHRAEGERRGRVALLTGCAQQVLAPSINEATIRLLTRMGLEVVVTRGQGCCGALDHHMGHHDPAMRLARANIAAWHAEIEAEGLDAVVINTSGCGTTVKDYGFMFRAEPGDWPAKAEAVASLAMDITEAAGEVRLRADPRGAGPDRRLPLRLFAAARPEDHGGCRSTLLEARRLRGEGARRARISAAAAPAPTTCCSRRSPRSCATASWRRSAAPRADLIAAGNIGCMTQLAGGALPMVHTVELLDWMAGGPAPPAVDAILRARAA